jgi:hypothetical protein
VAGGAGRVQGRGGATSCELKGRVWCGEEGDGEAEDEAPTERGGGESRRRREEGVARQRR